LKIVFDYLGIKRKFYYSELAREVIKEILLKEKKQLGEISIIFTDNKHILSINKGFLQHSYYTDVITFDSSRKNLLCGDIMISVDKVAKNAGKYSTSYEIEIMRVIIHGILHLIGYNDVNEKDKVAMKFKEEEYLAPVKIYFISKENETGI
jgi:rRNA maturation RNase YbeY